MERRSASCTTSTVPRGGRSVNSGAAPNDISCRYPPQHQLTLFLSAQGDFPQEEMLAGPRALDEAQELDIKTLKGPSEWRTRSTSAGRVDRRGAGNAWVSGSAR